MIYNHPPQNGTETTRHSNGVAQSKTPYVNGKKHGTQTVRYESGQKKYEITWRNHEKHGLETWWHENGNKALETYRLRYKKYARIRWDEYGDILKANLPPPPTLQAITNPKPIPKLKKMGLIYLNPTRKPLLPNAKRC